MAAPGSGVFEKERVTLSTSSRRAACLGPAWPQPLAVSYNRPRFSKPRNAWGTFSFFFPGQMSVHDRKHDWIQHKMLLLFVQLRRFLCLCYEVGSSPPSRRPPEAVALAWVSAHPRRHCCGVVLGCLQRSGDREGIGHPSLQLTSTAGWVSPSPSQTCMWVPVWLRRCRADRWGGDRVPYPPSGLAGQRDRAPWALQPLTLPFQPQLLPRRHQRALGTRGPAGGQALGSVFLLGWGEGRRK